MSTTTATRHYRTPEVERLTGLTYRRADYWCRRGVLGDLTPEARGSGTQRAFSTDAVHALTVCRRIADAATPEMPANPNGVGHQTFPLDTLRLAVRELADRSFPTDGFLAVCGDVVAWCADGAAVLAIVAMGGAWIVTALLDTDRPE